MRGTQLCPRHEGAGAPSRWAVMRGRASPVCGHVAVPRALTRERAESLKSWLGCRSEDRSRAPPEGRCDSSGLGRTPISHGSPLILHDLGAQSRAQSAHARRVLEAVCVCATSTEAPGRRARATSREAPTGLDGGFCRGKFPLLRLDRSHLCSPRAAWRKPDRASHQLGTMGAVVRAGRYGHVYRMLKGCEMVPATGACGWLATKSLLATALTRPASSKGNKTGLNC